MAGFFLKPSTGSHARSISLPARSHPTTLKIEEELNKLRNMEVSSSTSFQPNKLGIAIYGLTELYNSIASLLKLPQTQKALAKHEADSSWVDELLEESVSFLDLCENIRENLFLLRESIAKLQSSLRRRNTINNNNNYYNSNGLELDIEEDVSKFESFVKNMKRNMSKSLVVCLKQIDSKLSDSKKMNNNEDDQHVVAVIRVLREASLNCTFVFRSILGYFSGSILQPKGSKWSLVLKLVQNKGHRDCLMNEMENVDIEVQKSLMIRKLIRRESGVEMKMMMIQSTCEKLHEFDLTIQGVEKELECLFRQLIHTRVSLLNIISNH